jgi:hypothetical protein
LLIGVHALDLLPLVLVGRFLRTLDVQLGHFVHEIFHAGVPAHRLARLELFPADTESGVGAIKERLHDRGVLAWVHASHFDVVGKEGKVFKRDSLVLVVAYNVVHHALRGQRLSTRQIPREIQTRRPVVR